MVCILRILLQTADTEMSDVALHLDDVPVGSHSFGSFLLSGAAMHCQHRAACSFEHAGICQRPFQVWKHPDLAGHRYSEALHAHDRRLIGSSYHKQHSKLMSVSLQLAFCQVQAFAAAIAGGKEGKLHQDKFCNCSAGFKLIGTSVTYDVAYPRHFCTTMPLHLQEIAG